MGYVGMYRVHLTHYLLEYNHTIPLIPTLHVLISFDFLWEGGREGGSEGGREVNYNQSRYLSNSTGAIFRDTVVVNPHFHTVGECLNSE